jgi:uncharacterized repeat protein (TIGR03803 family)
MENSKRFWTVSVGWVFLLGAVALAGVAIAGGGDARAANLRTLYSFCAQGGSSCTDGAIPTTGVIKDAAGNLYGTTIGGGAYGQGTVFELIPSVGPWGQINYSEKVLYSFCAQGGVYCTDGAIPLDWNLLMDKWGNLYGTTIYGGANSTTNMTNPPFASGYAGLVFELSPNADKTNWTYRVLYSFCAQGGAGCTDGRGPQSGVIMGPDGRLYGSTSEGGAQNTNCRNGACGTIFELTPNADRSVWTHKLLYAFCKQGGAICADGANPHSGVSFAFGGLLGNAAIGGGAYSNQRGGAGGGSGGNVFTLTPNAPGAPWTYKVLYSFCSQPNCTDGSEPTQNSNVVDAAGRIYGTTDVGGIQNASCTANLGLGLALGCGVAYELTPSDDWATWTERVLYAFCQKGGTNCTDGATPLDLISDAAGNLIGTTVFGGANNQNGVMYEVNPHSNADDRAAQAEPAQFSAGATPEQGDWTHQTERVLYSFCAQPNCADSGGGGNVLTILAPGRFYSGTYGGGAYGQGVIFEFSR